MTLAFRPEAPAIRIAGLFDLQRHQKAMDLSVRPRVSDAHIDAVITSDTTQDYGMRTDSFTLFVDGRSTPFRAPKPPRTPWPLAHFALNDVTIVDKSSGVRTPLFGSKFIYEHQAPLKVEFLYTLGKQRLLVAAKHRADGRIRVRFLRADD